MYSNFTTGRPFVTSAILADLDLRKHVQKILLLSIYDRIKTQIRFICDEVFLSSILLSFWFSDIIIALAAIQLSRHFD